MPLEHLEQGDIYRIAAEAGVNAKTVDRFLLGEPGWAKVDRSIARAMRNLGYERHLPTPTIAKAQAR